VLGAFGETQPDQILYIPEALGGLSRIVDGYIAGPPELIVEVARSSRAFDLGKKKQDYERAGVPEYVVIELDPDRVHWFVLREGRYAEHPPGPDGVFRSEVFPGLWLDATAFYADDLEGLIATLDRGLATPEHAAFAARLAGAGHEG
jgi:Uma2 family endonuclease